MKLTVTSIPRIYYILNLFANGIFKRVCIYAERLISSLPLSVRAHEITREPLEGLHEI
jgi:hypothetical protein